MDKGKLQKGGSQWKNEYGQKHYEINRDVYIKRAIKRRKDIKNKFLEYKKTLKCKDCGLKDFRTLEFDHIDNNKSDNVCNLVVKGCSWETIVKEINKCDCVCSNCHSIRTYERRNAKLV